MLFIYALTPELAKELEEKGLRKMYTTTINGIETVVFENQKDVLLSKQNKFDQIMFTNRLTF